MQPNQQDSSYTQGSSLPSSNVPDFMQLNTQSRPNGNNKKKGLLVIIAVALVVCSVIAVSVIGFFKSETPEQQFYQALESLMQTSYLSRTIRINNLDTIVINSDFSNLSSPRSKATYESLINIRTAPNATPKQTKLKGDVVVTGKVSYAARITSDVPPWIVNTKSNRWYKAAPSNYQPDPLGLHDTINNPLNQVLVGNFKDQDRQQIIDFMKSSEVYTVKYVHSESVKGKKYFVYDTKIDYKKLKSLNGVVNALLKTSFPDSTITTSSQASFWVDEKTNKIVQITETIKDGKTLNVSAQIYLSYPKIININEPIGAEARV